MAMSEGERISRMLSGGQRFLSRQQTTDSSTYTHKVQARASGFVFARVSNKQTGIESSSILSKPDSQTECCFTTTAGRNNDAGYLGLYRAAEKCAVCSDPDPSATNGFAFDLSGGSITGGYYAPVPYLPNNAKTTSLEQCAACKQFYFPGQTRNCCAAPSNPALYPSQLPDLIDMKFNGYASIQREF
jgi:hypothetical protein